MKSYLSVTMNDRKLSMPLAEAVCLNCGGPLPESRAKTRRYCSASCRTTAYNLRVSERLVPTRDAGDSLLPQWVRIDQNSPFRCVAVAQCAHKNTHCRFVGWGTVSRKNSGWLGQLRREMLTLSKLFWRKTVSRGCTGRTTLLPFNPSQLGVLAFRSSGFWNEGST